MKRALLILLLTAVFLSIAAAVQAADVSQEAKYLWDGKWRQHGGTYGFYLNWFKIAAVWLIFLAWVGGADWISRDADDNNLNWQLWNPIVVGSFVAVLLLTWLVPWFWLNLLLLLGAAIAPATCYVIHRNGQMPAHQQVLTRSHLRYWLSERMSSVGVKISAEADDPNAGGVPVKVYARGGADKSIDGARLLAARQTTGLPLARKVLYQGLKARA
jgi:hypothetical protein